MSSEQKTNIVHANKRIERYVRVGESDVRIWECGWSPGGGEMGRHWFESADGIQTATYRDVTLVAARKVKVAKSRAGE